MKIVHISNSYVIMDGDRFYGGMSDDGVIWTNRDVAATYGMVKMYDDREKAEDVLATLSLRTLNDKYEGRDY